MAQRNSTSNTTSAGTRPVSKDDYLFLAALVEGKAGTQRVLKKDPHGEALRCAGEAYENREYVAAYAHLMPAYERIVADMKRILARNLEFEANKLARELQKPVAAAKERILNLRAHAQQVLEQIERLRQDLERKGLVRLHIKKGRPAEEAPPTTLVGAAETQVDSSISSKASTDPTATTMIGGRRYRKAPYAPPHKGALYSVRDRAKRERFIRILGTSPDGITAQIETLDAGKSSSRPRELAVESLARQAVNGWCSLLLPMEEDKQPRAAASEPKLRISDDSLTMRLDIQNFGRCCAEIARANIRFDTQLIKDVGYGPFRAGNYEMAFQLFEQFALGFTSAVTASRQSIAEGRRALMAEKGNLSGREIEERKAAFIRHEQLIHVAEREFSTILEGLRMYLRAQQDQSASTH